MTKTSSSLPDPAGSALAERYRLLSLALVEAASAERTEELAGLISERARVLEAMESLPAQSLPRPILEECVEIDRRLSVAMERSQASTLHHLVGSLRARQGARHYRRRDPSSPAGAFVAEG